MKKIFIRPTFPLPPSTGRWEPSHLHRHSGPLVQRLGNPAEEKSTWSVPRSLPVSLLLAPGASEKEKEEILKKGITLQERKPATQRRTQPCLKEFNILNELSTSFLWAHLKDCSWTACSNLYLYFPVHFNLRKYSCQHWEQHLYFAFLLYFLWSCHKRHRCCMWCESGHTAYSLKELSLLSSEAHLLLSNLIKRKIERRIKHYTQSTKSECKKRILLPSRRKSFDPWVRKIPWRGKRQPIPVFFPGKSHGQRSHNLATKQHKTLINSWLAR